MEDKGTHRGAARAASLFLASDRPTRRRSLSVPAGARRSVPLEGRVLPFAARLYHASWDAGRASRQAGWAGARAFQPTLARWSSRSATSRPASRWAWGRRPVGRGCRPAPASAADLQLMGPTELTTVPRLSAGLSPSISLTRPTRLSSPSTSSSGWYRALTRSSWSVL